MRYSSAAAIAVLLVIASRQTSVAQGAGGNAHAVIRSASGDSLGTLRLEQGANGQARLVGMLMGLPTGTHGIHVHAVGRCEGPKFESAGSHFNPHNRKHGLENPQGPHAGDAPNIVSDANKHAHVDIPFSHLTVAATSDSSVWDPDGSAVVIHAAADDQKTDPSGNSGDRIACGVLKRGN